jgi:hydrogenase maturation protease
MTSPDGALVAIGIGNVLLRDDGVGVRVVEALRGMAARDPGLLPPRTRLVDGGTLGLALLEPLEGARAALLIDAVDLGLPPGTVIERAGDVVTTGDAPGMHGLAELVGAARMLGALPAALAFVGIQVGEIDVDLALSPQVADALPRAVDAARRALLALDAQTGREAVRAPGAHPAGVTR